MADMRLENHEVRKGLWAFFLDCAFRMLIGWARRLRYHGKFTAEKYI